MCIIHLSMFSKPNAVPVRRSDRETLRIKKPQFWIIQPFGRQIICWIWIWQNCNYIVAWSYCICKYSFGNYLNTHVRKRFCDEKEHAIVQLGNFNMPRDNSNIDNLAVAGHKSCDHTFRWCVVITGCRICALLNIIVFLFF